MVTPTQVRMARAALNWGVKGLARKAGLNVNTVTRFEMGRECRPNTESRIAEALESVGVVFIPDGCIYGREANS